jgi:hypothetical protein
MLGVLWFVAILGTIQHVTCVKLTKLQAGNKALTNLCFQCFVMLHDMKHEQIG